jgi:hypothetical protein
VDILKKLVISLRRSNCKLKEPTWVMVLSDSLLALLIENDSTPSLFRVVIRPLYSSKVINVGNLNSKPSVLT